MSESDLQAGRVPAAHPARRALLGDQLRRNAQRLRDAEAIVSVGPDGRRAITYAQLDERSDTFAALLSNADIGRGDVVALLGRNSPEMLVAFWGAVKAGAAATGVNPAFKPGELHHQLTHSRARAVVLGTGLEGKPDELDPLPDLQLRVPESDLANVPNTPVTDGIPDVRGLHEDDPALIPYTSGTTALPKAVVLSHRTYISSTVPSFVAGLGYKEGDRFYYLMPLHTMAGIGSQISLLCVGATVVLPTVVTPDDALRTLADERITTMAQTPTFYLQMLRSSLFDAVDLSALERCVTYGGTMPEAMFDAFARVAPGMSWVTLWSQSELGQTPTVGWFRSLDDIPGQDPSWIGRPTPQLEVRIVDESGADADEGELLCRSPGVMLGYLDDPARTAEVLRDGWLHTGDLVRRGADGDLFFVDRRGDVIKSGGMNVSSVEVERVLYGHPEVLECAVVGLADDYWGQAVTAFVVPRGEQPPEPDALLALVRERLAAYKAPKEVRFVDALPKDAQGKILKRRIRSEADSAAARTSP